MVFISRNEKWRREYWVKRYLEYATQEQLSQRLRDICCNLTLLSNDGKISLRSPEEGGAKWFEKFAHVHEEHNLRGIYFQPNVMANAQIPCPTYPLRPKSEEVVRGRHLNHNQFLVKYGKRKYLKDGSIRISAASDWLKSDNLAIHDDELKKSFFAHPSDVVIKVHKSKNLPIGHKIEPVGNITFSHIAKSDYYALCLSRIYDHRLFDDFESDCCLIIHDPALFEKRLTTTVNEKLTGWSMFSFPMEYFDPFDDKQKKVNVHLSKDFKFWYQQEFRFTWIHPSPDSGFAPIDVAIGPIADFGELICLA